MSNTLGERRYYLYTSDAGTAYTYQTDEDLGTAVSAVLNDTNPGLPRRFKPRGVYVEAVVDGNLVRKFLICPKNNAAPYNTNGSTAVEIDGTTFKTTGRVGEKMSFGANPAAAT